MTVLYYNYNYCMIDTFMEISSVVLLLAIHQHGKVVIGEAIANSRNKKIVHHSQLKHIVRATMESASGLAKNADIKRHS